MVLLRQKNNFVELIKISEIKIIILLLVFFVLVACSSKRSIRVISFFFDGIPVKDSALVVNNSQSNTDTSNTDILRPDPIDSYSGFTVHYPYKEKDCFSCHDEKSKSELILPQPELCYTCHEDFSTKYKYVHGPVASGYCTICHNSHMSKEKKLLIRTGQQICLFCHESAPLFKSETHKDILDTECTLCHNPHGGEDRFVLN
jgi:predicted CXXCH cytochrome family protein